MWAMTRNNMLDTADKDALVDALTCHIVSMVVKIE